MKKIVVLLLVICTFGMFNNVNASTIPTLEEIAEKFNNHSQIKEFESVGSLWEASVSNGNLKISIRQDEAYASDVEFVLNIL